MDRDLREAMRDATSTMQLSLGKMVDKDHHDLEMRHVDERFRSLEASCERTAEDFKEYRKEQADAAKDNRKIVLTSFLGTATALGLMLFDKVVK